MRSHIRGHALSRNLVWLAATGLAFACARGGGGGGGAQPIAQQNQAPVLDNPTGPGSPQASGDDFTVTLNVGDSLDFAVVANDANASDNLDLRGTVAGGTLAPAVIGFATTFPAQAGGNSSVALALTGTAAQPGDITLLFVVTDGNGEEDRYQVIITVASDPPVLGNPTGPGNIQKIGANFTTLLTVGDSLNFSVTATDISPSEVLKLSLTLAGGSLSAAGAGFVTTFPVNLQGTSPLTANITGVAAAAGSIILLVTAEDKGGLKDTLLLTINIQAPPPPPPPVNNAPTLQAVVGPGTNAGGGVFNVFEQQSLNFTVVATDPDFGDTVTLTSTVIAGTLQPAGIGFTSGVPASINAISPTAARLNLTGAVLLGAGAGNNIVIEFEAKDALGLSSGKQSVNITILASAPAPVIQGVARFQDTTNDGLVNAGDQITVPFDSPVVLNGATIADFALPVFGDSFGAGAAVSQAVPASQEVTITLGNNPTLKARQDFQAVTNDISQASGINVALGQAGIASPFGGALAVPAAQAVDLYAGVANQGSIWAFFGLVDRVSDTRALAIGDFDNDSIPDLVFGNSGGGNDVLMSQTQPQVLGTRDTLSVAVADFNNDSRLDIYSGNADNFDQLFLNQGAGVFNASDVPGSDRTTQAVVAGDINGDGAADVIIGTKLNSLNLVYLFDKNTQLLVGHRIAENDLATTDVQAVALSDLDQDGDLDLVMGLATASISLQIFLNDGTGTFVLLANVGGGQALTRAVELADVNGDGFDDAIVAYTGGTPNKVFFNDKTGLLVDSGQSLGTGATTAIDVGDIDVDGDLDFVSAAIDEGTKVWLNNGAGIFSNVFDADLGKDDLVAMTDIDQDGDLEVITLTNGQVAELHFGTLSSLYGGSTPVGNGAAGAASSVVDNALVDVDGDGDLDLIRTTNSAVANDKTTVLLNDGSGIFTDSGLTLGNQDEFRIATGDLDQDGVVDLVLGRLGGAASIHRGLKQNGPFDKTVILAQDATLAVGAMGFVAIGDLDGDGDLDLVTSDSVNQKQTVLLNQLREKRKLEFRSAGVELGFQLKEPRLADFNNDGTLDLIVIDAGTEQMRFFRNPGDAKFVEVNSPLGTKVDSLELADLDQDGDLDIVAAEAPAGTRLAQVYLFNVITGAFAASGAPFGPNGAPSSGIQEVNLGDFDGDAFVDVFLTSPTAGEFDAVFVNDGTGFFSGVGTPLPTTSQTLALGDVDGDGDLDALGDDLVALNNTIVVLNR